MVLKINYKDKKLSSWLRCPEKLFLSELSLCQEYPCLARMPVEEKHWRSALPKDSRSPVETVTIDYMYSCTWLCFECVCLCVHLLRKGEKIEEDRNITQNISFAGV